MINVLIIINSFRLGGAEKLCYNLAEELSKDGEYRVYLYSLGKVDSLLEREVFAQLNTKSLSVGSFNKPVRRGRVSVVFRIATFCRRNRIDIIHTNGQSPDFYGRLSKILYTRVKTVVTIHSTFGYSKNVEKLQAALTNAYSAVSNEARFYSQNSLRIKRPIELIENGIDTKKYESIKKETAEFSILSVGRMEIQKNYLLAADFISPFLKAHPTVLWRIYGDITEHKEYYSQFVNRCKENGIFSSVKCLGVVTDYEEIYRNGNVFLLASDHEGFGIAFIEAIMCKLPIFAQKVGVLNDIVEHGGTIFDIGSSEAQEKVYQLFQDKNALSDVVEKNADIVRKLYSLETMTDHYKSLYSSLLR